MLRHSSEGRKKGMQYSSWLLDVDLFCCYSVMMMVLVVEVAESYRRAADFCSFCKFG